MTDTEIRVVWKSLTSAQSTVAALFEYFNRHFEFYGRRLVLVPDTQAVAADPVAQRAVANNIAALGAFAALEPSTYAWYPSLFQELARQGVLSIALSNWSFLSDRDVFDPLHPYVWSVYPSDEQLWNNTASFVCSSLAGKPAAHAAGTLHNAPRQFGVIATGDVRTPWIRPLTDAMAGCDATPVVVEWLKSRGDDASLRTALNQLRNAGVTTVICACADNSGATVSNAANAIGWTSPEWMGLSTNAAFDDWYLNNIAAPLRPQMFGIQPLPKARDRQNDWWWRAASEIDPTASVDYGYYAYGPYEQLLVLAAGIQGAGPNLTPETFAAGLMSSHFDNTDAGVAPEWLPSVGFGPGDHSFHNDYAIVWWSPDAPVTSPFMTRTTGSWCYLDQGARYAAGRFPRDADERLFDTTAPCR